MCIRDSYDTKSYDYTEEDLSGVHSGDSIAVYPPQHLSQEIIETLTRCV